MHWPALTQFWGLPYYGSQTEGAVSAGGRHFECINYRGFRGVTGKLRARSLSNGQVLWEQDLPPGLRPGAQNMVATPRALYVALSKEAPEVSVARSGDGGSPREDPHRGGQGPTGTLAGDRGKRALHDARRTGHGRDKLAH